MTLINTGFLFFPVSTKALSNAFFSSSGVSAKKPFPPNASIILSYRALGKRAVGGALDKQIFYLSYIIFLYLSHNVENKLELRVEVIRDWFSFALLRCVIGSENSRHFLN